MHGNLQVGAEEKRGNSSIDTAHPTPAARHSLPFVSKLVVVVFGSIYQKTSAMRMESAPIIVADGQKRAALQRMAKSP